MPDKDIAPRLSPLWRIGRAETSLRHAPSCQRRTTLAPDASVTRCVTGRSIVRSDWPEPLIAVRVAVMLGAPPGSVTPFRNPAISPGLPTGVPATATISTPGSSRSGKVPVSPRPVSPRLVSPRPGSARALPTRTAIRSTGASAAAPEMALAHRRGGLARLRGPPPFARLANSRHGIRQPEQGRRHSVGRQGKRRWPRGLRQVLPFDMIQRQAGRIVLPEDLLDLDRLGLVDPCQAVRLGHDLLDQA